MRGRRPQRHHQPRAFIITFSGHDGSRPTHTLASVLTDKMNPPDQKEPQSSGSQEQKVFGLGRPASFGTRNGHLRLDRNRSQSASTPGSTSTGTEPTSPKSKSLPALLPQAELYSHLLDTTTEVAPHPAALSPSLRSSSFSRRFSTPPHLSPILSPGRSRPPSPLASKTCSSSNIGYFDFKPSVMDTPMLDADRHRRVSVTSDTVLTPADDAQLSWCSSSPRALSQRGSEDPFTKAPASPELGWKLTGGDSPSSGTLERRARRRQVIRLDSFGGEGLLRKPSSRRLPDSDPDVGTETASVEIQASP